MDDIPNKHKHQLEWKELDQYHASPLLHEVQGSGKPGKPGKKNSLFCDTHGKPGILRKYLKFLENLGNSVEIDILINTLLSCKNIC